MVVCLVGFQLFRYVDSPTNTSKAQKKDFVYHHPTRLGGEKVNFIMQHDIYSLGVCLLEIGLWQSLVDRNGDITNVLRRLRTDKDSQKRLRPEVIKERLIDLSRNELKASMGDIYSKVVETCLTCLD